MIECVSVKINQLSHSVSPWSMLSFQGIVETLKNFCIYFSKKIAISGWKENEDYSVTQLIYPSLNIKAPYSWLGGEE